MARLRGENIERVKIYLGSHPEDWCLFPAGSREHSKKYEGYAIGCIVNGVLHLTMNDDDEMCQLVTEYLLKNHEAVFEDEESALRAWRARQGPSKPSV